MTYDEERDAYSRGLSDAYSDVFKAFTAAFVDGQDIHWLRAHIAGQWKASAQRRSGGMHERP